MNKSVFSGSRILFTLVFFALSPISLTAAEVSSAGMHLVSVKKLWDAGEHNAFTDLIRFKGNWFCTYRESAAHVGGDGKIRVLISKDGEEWKSAALVTEAGIDLRDPKLSITPDDRLMLLLGGSVYEGKVYKERQTRVAFSKEGENWTAPQRVLAKGDWLWRVTWHKGIAYGISYSAAPSADKEKKGQPERVVNLVSSTDGVAFRTVTKLAVSGSPNEATVRFLANGDAVALVRRETEDKQAWIGTSSAPYTDWKWNSSGVAVGGPNFLIFPDDSMVASGRQYNDKPVGAKTFVGRMNLKAVQQDLILPSGGDCSYPGMVMHDGLLWLSYYSSHEGKTSIYLAKIKLSVAK